jgi:aminoglycoside 6'-N-acetyltransferase I
MKIIDLNPDDRDVLQQCAEILYEGFKDMWPHICPDLPAAGAEVQQSLSPDRIGRVAIDETGLVLGWVGAIPVYDGHAWVLSPMVVRAERQLQGIGRALVEDLEVLVRQQGATTLHLGTDDTLGMTSLGNRDLYPNVLEHAANIRNLANHPYEFYQRLGYVIVGVIPDANGPGKPDIYMAKRLSDGGSPMTDQRESR